MQGLSKICPRLEKYMVTVHRYAKVIVQSTAPYLKWKKDCWEMNRPHWWFFDRFQTPKKMSGTIPTLYLENYVYSHIIYSVIIYQMERGSVFLVLSVSDVHGRFQEDAVKPIDPRKKKECCLKQGIQL